MIYTVCRNILNSMVHVKQGDEWVTQSTHTDHSCHDPLIDFPLSMPDDFTRQRETPWQ